MLKLAVKIKFGFKVKGEGNLSQHIQRRCWMEVWIEQQVQNISTEIIFQGICERFIGAHTHG